jgi:hypothetical protein
MQATQNLSLIANEALELYVNVKFCAHRSQTYLCIACDAVFINVGMVQQSEITVCGK